jgi:integrase
MCLTLWEHYKRLPFQDAYQSFKRFCKYSALPYITPHGLRHTCATMLVAHGRPIKTIAEMLGDDPTTIEKTYAHNTPAMRAEMLQTIERVYEEGL